MIQTPNSRMRTARLILLTIAIMMSFALPKPLCVIQAAVCAFLLGAKVAIALKEKA